MKIITNDEAKRLNMCLTDLGRKDPDIISVIESKGIITKSLENMFDQKNKGPKVLYTADIYYSIFKDKGIYSFKIEKQLTFSEIMMILDQEIQKDVITELKVIFASYDSKDKRHTICCLIKVKGAT